MMHHLGWLSLGLKASLGGAVIGVIYGVAFGPLSVNSILAAAVAGAIFFLLLAPFLKMGTNSELPSRRYVALCAIPSGAAAGIAWWFVVRPDAGWWIAALIGAGLGAFTMALEWKTEQPDTA